MKNDKRLRIDFDDDDKDIFQFEKFLKDTTNYNKKTFSDEISKKGDELLKEIKQKKRSQSKEKKEKINYIYSSQKRKKYTKKYLNSLDISDIRVIYKETKKENKGIFKKIIDFVFFN